MTTPPDKCPKCGSEPARLCGDIMFSCGRQKNGTYETGLCLMTQRANREHERAEKWKACATKLDYASGHVDSDKLTEAWNEFDALMKDEQK